MFGHLRILHACHQLNSQGLRDDTRQLAGDISFIKAITILYKANLL